MNLKHCRILHSRFFGLKSKASWPFSNTVHSTSILSNLLTFLFLQCPFPSVPPLVFAFSLSNVSDFRLLASAIFAATAEKLGQRIGEGRSLPVGGSFERELLPFVDFSKNSLIRYDIRFGTRNIILYMQILLQTGFSYNRFFVSDYKEQARSGPKDFPRYKHSLLQPVSL